MSSPGIPGFANLGICRGGQNAHRRSRRSHPCNGDWGVVGQVRNDKVSFCVLDDGAQRHLDDKVLRGDLPWHRLAPPRATPGLHARHGEIHQVQLCDRPTTKMISPPRPLSPSVRLRQRLKEFFTVESFIRTAAALRGEPARVDKIVGLQPPYKAALRLYMRPFIPFLPSFRIAARCHPDEALGALRGGCCRRSRASADSQKENSSSKRAGHGLTLALSQRRLPDAARVFTHALKIDGTNQSKTGMITSCPCQQASLSRHDAVAHADEPGCLPSPEQMTVTRLVPRRCAAWNHFGRSWCCYALFMCHCNLP